MKNLKIIFLLLLFVIIYQGCEDDYLQLYPKDKPSSETFWRTTNDLELYVNQFYNVFRVYAAYDKGIYWDDANSDNMIKRTPDSRIHGTWVKPGTSSDYAFSQFRSINVFLENYQKCEDPFDNYKHYLGEAYFFRAFLHFDKVRKYGNAPWLGKTLQMDSPELYEARTPRSVVVDSVIADLDKAIEYMNSGKFKAGNRLSKEIAMLFKSRVCLYEGTWEKYHAGTVYGVQGSDGRKYLELAASTSANLISRDIFDLYSTGDIENDYFNVFNQLDYSGNPEVMFWKKYSKDLDVWHSEIQGSWEVGITKELVDAYLCEDGLPISQSSLFGGYDSIESILNNRDPRLRQTVYKNGDQINQNGTALTVSDDFWVDPSTSSWVPATGFLLKKGDNHEYVNMTMTTQGVSGSIIFRYAEALLILAEAKAELGTLNQADVDNTINRLRDRVGMPHLTLGSISTDPNWDFPDLSPIINEIRRERRVELACEGYRQDDLMRWRAHHLIVGKTYLGMKPKPEWTSAGGLITNDDGYVDIHMNAAPSGYGFDPERDYLYPIPTNERTLNPNLNQNPGW